MVPVRKPGRPLSSCPHPTSKPCTCGTVTAAIPRKQTCGCGPSNLTSQTSTEPEETSPPSVTSDEPRSATSSFRVRKASRSGSNRKMSIDLANLERMDSSQVNIMSSYNPMPGVSMGMSNGHIPAVNGMGHYPVMGMGSPDGTFTPQPMMFPMFQQHMSSPMVGSAAPRPASNGHSTPTADTSPIISAQSVKGSCCGGGEAEKHNGDTPKPDFASGRLAPNLSKPRPNGEKAVGSCCSSKSFSNDSKAPSGCLTPPETFPQTGGMMMPSYPHPIVLPNGMYGIFPQPTLFHYPPQYGTFMQPLQPEQWRQVMASLAFGQMAQPPQSFDMGGAMPGAVPFSPTNSQPKSMGTSHRCTCGDGCQCVGCAAHPYNEATQNYVRSAWSTMMEDANVSTHTNGNVNLLNGNHNHNHDQNHGHHSANGNQLPMNGHHNGHHDDHVSPTEQPVGDANSGIVSASARTDGTTTNPQTPSDAASSLAEEQTLSANDFFFVTYPFGDSCAGETASCPCGDDCQCIGCVIHNNPDPTQVSEPISQ
jgi:hypothetical protein